MVQITIDGPIERGPSWDALEHVIETMLDDTGRLTRISRRDGQANYRATSGIYDLTWCPDAGDEVLIELRINASHLTGGKHAK